MSSHFKLAIIIFNCCILCISCATNPVTGKKELVLMSENQEISLGKSYHPQIVKEYGIYNDSKLQQYVQKIGNDLATQSHRKDIKFRFTVLDSPTVNAFALPGGYIYITRGILAYLNSEAELAGVLGHEVGHVTARHAVQRHTNTTTASLLNTIIMMKTHSQPTANLVNLFGGALISGYGRKQELQSDRLGSEYLAKTGYAPENMLNVIGVLKNQEIFANELTNQDGRNPQSYHGLFATHPENDARLKAVITAAKQFQIAQPRDNNQKIYLQHINNMVYGQNESQGIVREGVFYHPKLNFTLPLPKEWSINNLSDRIILSDTSKDALLQITVDKLKEKTSAKAYLTSILGQHNETEAFEFTINGQDAFTAVATKQYAFGNRDTRFIVILKDKHAYLFIGLSKTIGNLASFDSLFLQTAKGFHAMTKNEKAKAKPYRIALKIVSPSDSYETLTKTSLLDRHPEQRLRLLNAHYPNGKLTPGQTIKIIQ